MPQFDTLFLTEEQNTKEAFRSALIKTIDAAISGVTDKNAYAGPIPQKLKEIIHVDEILPKNGLGFEQVLEHLKTKVIPNVLRTFSTDYMAHLHSAALIESICAELLISTFNQSMDSWDQSPVATEIELQVIQELCTLYSDQSEKNSSSDNRSNCGFSDGTFTSGGSQSNETALILARDWFCNNHLHHDVKKYGLPDNFKKFRLYTSCISHFSMEKSAHILGLGYECVVKVPVTNKKKMDCVALRNLIECDIKNGNLPFCVVATVGTTDFGSIDSIDEIVSICKEHNLWLHADAAYGSGVILSQKYANRVASISKCDSVTVDFHKMFMQPISCSVLLIKETSDFAALTIHADYLNRTEDEEDGYTNLVDKSIQTTRRFDALKVWVSFQTRGKDGWSDLITTCMDNANYLYNAICKDSEFEAVCEPEISSVVFRVCGKSSWSKEKADEINKKIRRSLIHDHGVVIGQTVSDGYVCLKFTLLNPLVTHKKLDELLSLIKKIKTTMLE